VEVSDQPHALDALFLGKATRFPIPVAIGYEVEHPAEQVVITGENKRLWFVPVI
jgi:hypothetical protein